MRYRCCICEEVFPAEDRIDAYNQGYHVGFLCPLCGANIQDAKFATYNWNDWKQSSSQEQTGLDIGRLIYFISVTVLAIAIKTLELTIPVGGYQIDWRWFLIAAMLLYVVNIYIRWPEQLFNPVAATVPVPNSKNESGRARYKQPWET